MIYLWYFDSPFKKKNLHAHGLKKDFLSIIDSPDYSFFGRIKYKAVYSLNLYLSPTSYKWSWLAWSAELRLFKHTYLVLLPCNLLGEERFILYMPLSSVLLPSVILYIGIWINNQWYTCDILSVPSRKRICLRMFFLWAQPSAFQVWNNQLKLNAS